MGNRLLSQPRIFFNNYLTIWRLTDDFNFQYSHYYTYWFSIVFAKMFSILSWVFRSFDKVIRKCSKRWPSKERCRRKREKKEQCRRMSLKCYQHRLKRLFNHSFFFLTSEIWAVSYHWQWSITCLLLVIWSSVF